MTKYKGEIELKEIKVAKNMQQYAVYTIDKKKWNCFSPEVNQEFHVGDYVEFETEKKGEYENLIPETMKRIDAPEPAKSNPQGHLIPLMSSSPETSIQKTIHENPDSLTIGTPGKGGEIKCYGDYNEPEEFIVKFTNAKKVRDEANRLLSSDVI